LRAFVFRLKIRLLRPDRADASEDSSHSGSESRFFCSRSEPNSIGTTLLDQKIYAEQSLAHRGAPTRNQVTHLGEVVGRAIARPSPSGHRPDRRPTTRRS